MKKYPVLYSRDSAGNIRTWWMEQDGNAMRSVACNHLGTETRSGWKYAEAKNVGRSNATNAEQQAEAEILSIYKKKVEIGGYAYTVDEIGKKHFQPMLAETWNDKALEKGKIKISGGWIQPKLDGLRCIVNSRGMWSRNGKPLPGAPHVFEHLKHVFDVYPDAVFDGELYNHELKNDFEKIVSLVKKEPKGADRLALVKRLVQYHVYDLPVLNESDADQRTFQQRMSELMDLKTRGFIDEPIIHIVETVHTISQDQIDDWYSKWMTQDYEGMMFRHDVPYVNDRDWALVKRKEFMDAEFEVADIQEGVGNWAGYAKRIVCRLGDGRTFESGMRGTQTFARVLLLARDEYVGGTATIRFQKYTADGIPRFGVMTQIYRRGEERL